MRLVVQNDIQQRTVDFDASVVVNKTQFSKFVHEKTHAGPGRSDHLRKRLLADFREDRLRFLFLAKVRQQQEQAGKTFLTRIEQLIDEVCLDADGPIQKMGNEHLGERRFLLNHAENSRFLQSHDDGASHRRDRRYALRLPVKTSFTEELVRSMNCDDCFLALLRNDGDLHLASLDVEDRIRGISCEKKICSLWYPSMLRPSPTLARKDFGSNDGRRLIAMTRPSAPRVTEKRTFY